MSLQDKGGDTMGLLVYIFLTRLLFQLCENKIDICYKNKKE